MTSKRDFGAIRKLPSGKYQASYRRNGARHYAPDLFRTKDLAGDWLSEQRAAISKGTWSDPNAGSVTFREYATAWLTARDDLEERTVELYTQQLDDHILPAFGEHRLRDVTPEQVRVWRAKLPAEILNREKANARRMKRKPRRNVTGKCAAAKTYRLLSQIMRSAVIDDLIPKSPCRVKRGGKEVSAERETVTLSEAQVVIDAMPERMQAALLLAVWCQNRRGELFGARRRDLQLAKAKQSVRTTRVQRSDGSWIEKAPKSAAGKRTLAIPEHIIPELAEHMRRFVGKSPDAYVFTGVKGGPLSASTFYKHWNRAKALIGRPDLVPHDLRHTGLTLFGALGATTAELMHRGGHSTPDASLRYQHATESRDRLLADAASALARRSLPPEPPATPLAHGWRTSVNSGVSGRPGRDDESDDRKHVLPGHDAA
jgi:integrase